MCLVLNEKEMSVYADGVKKELTPKEYGILSFLMSHPDETFTPEEIYRHAWNLEPYACRPVISVHMRHLRQKIEKDPDRPALLLVRWGYGYRFCRES